MEFNSGFKGLTVFTASGVIHVCRGRLMSCVSWNSVASCWSFS